MANFSIERGRAWFDYLVTGHRKLRTFDETNRSTNLVVQIISGESRSAAASDEARFL